MMQRPTFPKRAVGIGAGRMTFFIALVGVSLALKFFQIYGKAVY
ncbi:hypothetical protein [Methyloglobulus sp.]